MSSEIRTRKHRRDKHKTMAITKRLKEKSNCLNSWCVNGLWGYGDAKRRKNTIIVKTKNSNCTKTIKNDWFYSQTRIKHRPNDQRVSVKKC